MSRQLILSCEHAGNEIPQAYQHLFEGHRDVLQTHRGIDIGALDLTNSMARKMKQEAYIHSVSRLLVDVNRSLHNPSVFSEFVERQPKEVKEKIIARYYRPHRDRVETAIEKGIADGDQVIHIGVHTFTPVWDGKEREVDIGFLYDPQRATEKQFCRSWRANLELLLPDLTYRMNYPYRGVADGLTTSLRERFSAKYYCGIELEVSQRFAEEGNGRRWAELQDKIAESFEQVFNYFE